MTERYISELADDLLLAFLRVRRHQIRVGGIPGRPLHLLRRDRDRILAEVTRRSQVYKATPSDWPSRSAEIAALPVDEVAQLELDL